MTNEHLIPNDDLSVPERWNDHPAFFGVPILMALEAHWFKQTDIAMVLVNIMRGRATRDDLDLALLGLSIANPRLLRDKDHLRWCQKLCLKMGRDDLLEQVQMRVNREENGLLL